MLTYRVPIGLKYGQVGAILSEDLSSCGLILGVKEVPGDQLLPDKTYMFFSHTIKAQPYNMPMLDIILNKVRKEKKQSYRAIQAKNRQRQFLLRALTNFLL